MQIQPVKQLRGEVSVPGDKSISHRSIMFGALAKGTTEITHFLHGADCLSTIGCFRAMGINIEDTPDRILVHGKGLHGLSEPSSFLDVGNSGTTTRLISGILSGQPFATTLSGDASLNSRPMKRIMEPLGMMGADILSQNGNGCAPLLINSLLPAGQNPSLHAIHYHSKVASAQVKSSVLLAGLYADGLTLVTEPVLSRNHTELMLNGFGANVQTEIHSDGRDSGRGTCPFRIFIADIFFQPDRRTVCTGDFFGCKDDGRSGDDHLFKILHFGIILYTDHCSIYRIYAFNWIYPASCKKNPEYGNSSGWRNHDRLYLLGSN